MVMARMRPGLLLMVSLLWLEGVCAGVIIGLI